MKIYSKEKAKNKIKELVEFYDENKTKISIDETMIRSNFVDLLFTYLNWDVYNQNRRPLTEKFVYEEERITVNGNKKRTDYTFCGGSGGIANRVFFVEAKKPSTNIDKEFEPVFQLRRYGWSAGLYISVLTNFENFVIYNTKNIQPAKTDLPNKGQLDSFKYTDFVARFDELWELFEFENVLEGSIIEYARRKGIIPDTFIKGEKTVDNAFLMQIENWRKTLAQNIVLQQANKNISTSKEKLNYAVQKIIDRIIFLRIIEDRGLEPNETLKNASKNYQTLCELFDYADDKYNSGLFHFTDEINRGIPDTITKDLVIYDTVIKDIITPLYDGNPYAFDVMPAYILGAVYEQFLGQEIDLSRNTVKIDNKPEVRKSGGVYYTPEHIVEYIVNNTVSKNQDVKILDPACGSGSFLLVAYQYMLDFYQKKNPNSLLTLQERKQILLDHIYGVDIDEQAVEVTKLSLLLKVLEGISKKEIEKLQKKEYILPSLHENIKCGNSLIDDATVAGEKAFVWDEEFPEIFANGGFDCVIGNPPYIDSERMVNLGIENQREYLSNKLEFCKGNWDIYIAFINVSFNLINGKGKIGMITPDKWLVKPFGYELRKGFFKYFEGFVDAGSSVFKDANVDSILTFISKKENNNLFIRKLDNSKITVNKKIDKTVIKEPFAFDWLFSNSIEIINCIEKNKNVFSNYAICENACSTSDCYKLKEYITNSKYNTNKHLKIINTGTIDKYISKWGNKEMVYLGDKYLMPVVDKKIFQENFKNTYSKKSILPKIIIKGLTKLDACLDYEGIIIPGKSTIIITIPKGQEHKLLFSLGLINSKLMYFYIKEKYKGARWNQGITFTKDMINNFPVPDITSKQQKDIIKLVDKILQLKLEGQSTRKFENEIDEIVYELYGLSDAEIRTVEGK